MTFLNLNDAAVEWSELNEASGLEGFKWEGDLVAELAETMVEVWDQVVQMSDEETFYSDILGEGGDVMLMLDALSSVALTDSPEGPAVDLDKAEARYVEIVRAAGLDEFEFDGGLVEEAFSKAADLYALAVDCDASGDYDPEIRSLAFDLGQMVQALSGRAI